MSIHKGNLETKTGNNTSDILYPKTSIDMVVGLPVPTSADSGKYLGVDSNGNFALISGSTPTGYTVTVTNGNIDNVVLYDGQDNTGTLLGTILMGETESYTITSGYIFAEWDDPYITDDVTFAEDGSDIGNPVQVTSNMSIEVWDVPSTITFTIENTTYQANAGMTWSTWCGSTYNIDNAFYVRNNLIRYRRGGDVGKSMMGYYVTPSEEIISNFHYYILGGN